LRAVERLVAGESSGYVCFCEGNLLALASRDRELQGILRRADLLCPDGIAAVALARRWGAPVRERVSGPAFLLAACAHGLERRWRHYFYGGAPGVAERLSVRLAAMFPGLEVAGMHAPPFRALTPSDDAEDRLRIEATRPDLLWVGLGGPKQERWMARQRGSLRVPVMLGVGAAFDFHSGERPWAPRFVRRAGLEWAWRMATGGPRVLARNVGCVADAARLLLAARPVRFRSTGRNGSSPVVSEKQSVGGHALRGVDGPDDRRTRRCGGMAGTAAGVREIQAVNSCLAQAQASGDRKVPDREHPTRAMGSAGSGTTTDVHRRERLHRSQPRGVTGTILFFGSSYRIGLTSLMVAQMEALEPVAAGELTCIAGEREQSPGLRAQLGAAGIQVETIVGLDDHAKFYRLVEEFGKIVERRRPRVVHVQTNWQLAIAAVVRWRTRQSFRLIYTVHGYRHNHRLRSKVAQLIMSTSLRYIPDDVVVCSSDVRRKFGAVGSGLQLLFIGVDDAFRGIQTPLSARGSTKQIVFPGEFRQGKNQDLLIAAVGSYVKRSGDRDVRLVLPGQGPRLERCRALANSLGINELVEFPGRVSLANVASICRASHVAVIPSNSETFGSCIAESLASGCLVLSRPVGVARDVIVHGRTGFLFSSGRDLTSLLLRILPEIESFDEVAERGYASSMRFHWTEISHDYMRMLQRPPGSQTRSS